MTLRHDYGSPARLRAGIEPRKKEEAEKDINRFVELYKSFGIELIIKKDSDDYKLNPGGFVIILDGGDDKKFVGEDGISSAIHFDKDGKFIEQGFWE